MFYRSEYLSNLKTVPRCFVEWITALALWALFTFSLSLAELCAGAACATLTVIALEVTFKGDALNRWLGLRRAARSPPSFSWS